MTQYRIGELAEVSGVNARNIRAYRERGLLDPPDRVGRAAIYTDLHVAQLRVINQLLSKGFTSTHIADFFAVVRSGRDLADVLGLQDVCGGVETDDDAVSDGGPGRVAALPFGVEPSRRGARRMIAAGLARRVDGELMLIDPELVRIVSGAPSKERYLATIVDVFESIQDGIAATAEDVDSLLEAAAAEVVDAGVSQEPARVLQDYRELAAIIITRQIEEAVRGHAVRSTA